LLIILHDPHAISGRERHDLDYTISLQVNIERHLMSGFECSLVINGHIADPLTDPRLDLPPQVGDTVAVIRRPAGFDPFSWAAIALYVVIAAVVVYAVMSRPPNSLSGSSKDSPNNALTAQTNIARAYQAIPDVYGYRRVWPDLIQPSTVEYINQVKYVTEWLCASRGKGTIEDVQYAETAINDIDGASFQVFEPVSSGYPEHGTTTLTNVVETFDSPDVNGQELSYPQEMGAVSRVGSFTAASGATSFTVTVTNSAVLDDLKSMAPSGQAVVSFSYGAGPTSFSQTCTVLGYVVAGSDVTFTFSSSAWATAESGTGVTFTLDPVGSNLVTVGPFTLPVECDHLHWNLVFTRGLKGTVQTWAEWWKIDASDVEIPGTRQSQRNDFGDSTYDQRFFTVKVAPSGGHGRYRIRFRRLNGQVDSNGVDIVKVEELYAARYYATKTLPGVTIIRITTRATEAATGFSERKFNLRWTRHVRTLASDTLSPSRNFARTMAHIWTLAGNDMSGLDVAKLQAINTALGETSPLLRFDCSLDDADTSLGERLQLVANHARCQVWRDGPRWTVTREEAKAYPELQLDYRNLSASGDSSISYSSHLPASFDGVELEYVKEDTQASKAYVRLAVSSGSIVESTSSNQKKIQVPGCVTQAQAMNRARLEARRLLYQRTAISDTALSDAASLGLGSLVRWIDPNDFAGDDGLQAGEVLAISGLQITTSEPLDWQGATTGRILLTGEDGAYLGSPITCTPVNGGALLASMPVGAYVADTARQCGSRYAFAVGVTDAEMEASGLYTITEIRPDQKGAVSLAFAQYDARMFEDD
jgi:hypothetical protein